MSFAQACAALTLVHVPLLTLHFCDASCDRNLFIQDRESKRVIKFVERVVLGAMTSVTHMHFTLHFTTTVWLTKSLARRLPWSMELKRFDTHVVVAKDLGSSASK